jgi:hypothetical protein
MTARHRLYYAAAVFFVSQLFAWVLWAWLGAR